jgi:DNA-binding response OmpR family regulator
MAMQTLRSPQRDAIQKEARAARQWEPAPAQLQRLNVLFVTQEHERRARALFTLSRSDVVVSHVGPGVAALRAALLQDYDVIVLDIESIPPDQRPPLEILLRTSSCMVVQLGGTLEPMRPSLRRRVYLLGAPVTPARVQSAVQDVLSTCHLFVAAVTGAPAVENARARWQRATIEPRGGQPPWMAPAVRTHGARIQDFFWDRPRRILYCRSGVRIALSRLEADFVEALLDAAGAPVSTRALAGKLSTDRIHLTPRTVTCLASRLRRKLREAAHSEAFWEMVAGRGYRVIGQDGPRLA